MQILLAEAILSLIYFTLYTEGVFEFFLVLDAYCVLNTYFTSQMGLDSEYFVSLHNLFLLRFRMIRDFIM